MAKRKITTRKTIQTRQEKQIRKKIIPAICNILLYQGKGEPGGHRIKWLSYRTVFCGYNYYIAMGSKPNDQQITYFILELNNVKVFDVVQDKYGGGLTVNLFTYGKWVHALYQLKDSITTAYGP